MGFGRGRGRGRGKGKWGGSSRAWSTDRMNAMKGSSRSAGDRNGGDDYDPQEMQRSKMDRLVRQAELDDRMDKKFGYEKHTGGPDRLGWLMNMQPTCFRDTETNQVRSAVDYYFMQEDGKNFKVTMPYSPYFLLRVKDGLETEVEQFLRRKFENQLAVVERVDKEDLDLKNHLIGLKQTFLKLSFPNVQDLMTVRNQISIKRVKKNKTVHEDMSYHTTSREEDKTRASTDDLLDAIIDIREYDVPYHMRTSLDLKINVGKWYECRVSTLGVKIEPREDLLIRPDPIVLAFDIETTKLPLKFPNMELDNIMMISYMLDRQGYLIINREILTADIEDFEYTPKPEFEGPFIVMNEESEAAMLQKFFDHIKDVKPHIFVTYNGDSFDWPFVERRAEILGINMYNEIGFQADNQGEYKSRYAPHMDAFRWVKRDSYLPVGSQGLKAVTKAKLRYDPLEVHYEDICRMASEQPQELANYSVSDAVATYYLYMKYVNPFIFALCTIIPLGPDDVLRKGSGTLCEALLMYNAFHMNIVMPNKQETMLNKMYKGHLLESETYVGGHVEALESGVFRNDIPCRFKIVPQAMQTLIDDVDNALQYCIEVEHKGDMSTITNYEEQRDKLVEQLEDLRDNPYRSEVPLIYHLDVAAMYPNIILTNRLQPSAMVDEATCASCDFNKPDSDCQRRMKWIWRGDYAPATRSEFEMIKMQLESEKVEGENPEDAPRPFHSLSTEEQAELIKKRLKDYCRKVYKKTHITLEEESESTVCQRENPFYIDTVRNFRDVRYVYKGKLKAAKKDLEQAEKSGDPGQIKQAANFVVLYDSLQLAHKCILNSFYGYVMRRGARWYSMEMAGIVCLTGSNIITKAREIVEQIGRPLELDTDGIWCCLPGTFPENIEFTTTEPGKKAKIVVSYPGAMLNVMVKDHFTNDQYQTLADPNTLQYDKTSVNSIFFEVDGPYKAMILPASKEKDKRLKKRYAVFELDGSLAELKGFEVKRRGELKIIKIFQSAVFESFLQGDSLETVYDACADVANHWLDVLENKGLDLADHELFDLISENRSMSRTLADYGSQKSTSISTAKRLAEFLGDEMVKDKGLACSFIISKYPEGSPVTERAIPTAIFQAEEHVKRHYLKRWLKCGNRLVSFDIRDILDWGYYVERLGSAIQKIITIPAAMQKVANPVPRIKHPDWLQQRLLEKKDPFKQQKITEIFGVVEKPSETQPFFESEPESSSERENSPEPDAVDMEDQFSGATAKKGKRPRPRVTVHQHQNKKRTKEEKEQIEDWRTLGKAPSMRTDYENWLIFQKKKWNLQRLARRAQRLSGVSAATLRSRGAGLGAYISRQYLSVTQQHWQILQISETDDPGILRVWSMVNGDLHKMKIEVPRRFYVNLRTPETDAPCIRVSRALPRSQPVLNLFEFEMPEQQYVDNQRSLQSYFTHPDVQGVYETKVTLLWRAIVELGNVPSVNKDAALNRDYKKEAFRIEELKFGSTGDFEYIKEPLSFQRIYIYHSETGNRSTIGIFFSATETGHVYFVDEVRTALQLPNVTKLWKQIFQKFDSKGHEQLPSSDMAFTSSGESSFRDACLVIHQLLVQYTSERHGPTIVIIQSPVRQEVFASQIPAVNDFPVVTAPSNARDNVYPALNWHRPAAIRMLHHFAQSDQWFENQVNISRYSHIPVGNLPSDYPPFVSDVFFARSLKKHNHVLWASPSERPDLGGTEEDDNRLMTEIEGGNAFEVNEPGEYDGVCVELNVNSLAVNTILHSTHINDSEGGAGSFASFDNFPQHSLEEMMGHDGPMNSVTMFDETAQCMPVFRVLKGLVHMWLHEVANQRNVFADTQLVHFYRWLKLSGNLLYDPALLRMVCEMMRKLFSQLIAEFRRLGSTVVYASFTKIVISTDKSNCADARKYVDYILTCIKGKDLFSSIDIEPAVFWEHLIWMDTANYGGVLEQDYDQWTRGKKKRRRVRSNEDGSERDSGPRAEGGRILSSDEEDDEEDMSLLSGTGQPEIQVEMHWNIMEYLPPEIVQAQFERIIGEWIFKACENRLKERRQRGALGLTPVKRRPKKDGEEQEFASTSAKLLKEVFAEKLMKIVPAIAKALPGNHSEQGLSPEFPQRAGSYLPMNNPALEFTKFVTAVLALNKEIGAEVTKLRSNLLRLIRIREFSAEAQFKNPCLSFVLTEVICTFCNSVRDMDLCRDKDLIEGEWKCQECENVYDRNFVEDRLLENVQRQSMLYQLQDLSCLKCKMIKSENLASYCNCSGNHTATIDREDFFLKMQTLYRIAEFHKLELLQEGVAWVLKMNHQPLQ